MTFTTLFEGPCRLAESPVWDERRAKVFFTDIEEATVHGVALDGSDHTAIAMPGHVGSLGLCESGRLMLAMDDGLAFLEPERGHVTPFLTLPDVPAGVRCNDGKIGPDGCFWVGTTDTRKPKRPVGTLYRVAPDATVTKIAGDLNTPNGLAWSSDSRVMMRSDSRDRWIARAPFDPATGRPGAWHVIARPDAQTGRPDGAAMDTQGRYWSAGVSSGTLNVWTAQGDLDQVIPLPVPWPTMPAFCGPDLKTVVVTSLVRPAEAGDPPLGAGRVIVADSSVAGVAVPRFDDRAWLREGKTS